METGQQEDAVHSFEVANFAPTLLDENKFVRVENVDHRLQHFMLKCHGV